MIAKRLVGANGRRLEPEPSQNWLYEDGAKALAQSIKAFWRERGYRHVKVWAENIPMRTYTHALIERWVVRSNMVNGLPPKSMTCESFNNGISERQ